MCYTINDFWGKRAIEAISEQLDSELPGLRGFTSRNLRYMRTFYEEWKMLDIFDSKEQIPEESLDNLELASSKLSRAEIMSIGNLQVPNCQEFPMDVLPL